MEWLLLLTTRSVKVKLYVKLLVQLFKLVPHEFANFSDGVIFPIELAAVIEDELHVVEEFLHAMVVVSIKALLNSAEVHGVLYDIEVVGHIIFSRVDWVVEDPGLVELPKSRDQALGCFIPRLIDWSVFRHFWQLKLV